MPRIRFQVGDTFNLLTVERIYKTDQKWSPTLCDCICQCGKKTVVRVTQLQKDKVKSCGCIIRTKRHRERIWKGHGEISGEFFRRIKTSALKRGIEFDLCIENLWDQYQKQEGKCHFSGVPLVLPYHYKDFSSGVISASLDRIQSKLPYTPDNIQWVHKTLNLMKQGLNEDEFFKWCSKVHFFQENNNGEIETS